MCTVERILRIERKEREKDRERGREQRELDEKIERRTLCVGNERK